MMTISRMRNESMANRSSSGIAPLHKASPISGARVRELDPGEKRMTQVLFRSAGDDGRDWTFTLSDDRWAISAGGTKIAHGDGRRVCVGVEKFFSLSGAPASVPAECTASGAGIGALGAGRDIQVKPLTQA